MFSANLMMSRSLSSLRLTPSRSSGDGWDIQGVIIDKETLEEILTEHYGDSALKVSESAMFCLSLSPTNLKSIHNLIETINLYLRYQS